MRNAPFLAVSSTLGFMLYCIGAAVVRLWTELSQSASTVIFLAASFALLGAFIFAGLAVAQRQPTSRSRVAAAVLLVVAGFPVSWLLGVNAGRLAAGMVGLAV
jgi:hypothetical protein